jgi:transcriptional regulator with XRE-family HTH domain
MIIGNRIRALREARNLSQGDIQERTGLLRCYISRVENGHTVPSIETLEKLAQAFETPLYQVLYDGEGPPTSPVAVELSDNNTWGKRGKEARYLERLRQCLSKMSPRDRSFLLLLTSQIVKKNE